MDSRLVQGTGEKTPLFSALTGTGTGDNSHLSLVFFASGRGGGFPLLVPTNDRAVCSPAFRILSEYFSEYFKEYSCHCFWGYFSEYSVILCYGRSSWKVCLLRFCSSLRSAPWTLARALVYLGVIVIVLHMTLSSTNVTLRLYLLKLSGNTFWIFAYFGNLFRILPWPITEYCHIVRSQNQIQFQYSGNQCLAHFHNFRQLQWESNYCNTIFRTQLWELPMAVKENFFQD